MKSSSFSDATLGKAYEPETFEKIVYQFWESNGLFAAQDENAAGQKSFAIMLPPPNVTGVLHMGHALTNTIEDILVRWHRMKGDNTLWLPGTDHAGIATQAQVEKAIRPQTRHQLGREKFLERTWKWKEDHENEIKNQMRRLGSSFDWKRERFTMDEGFTRAVREVFVRLYKEDLIYRGERIINWCPRCQTALSDLEVIPTERKGSLWHIQYPIEGLDEKLTIATTRPETLLGDTAVAVHPEDERYKHLKGKKVKLPLLGRLIPIIRDEYVDREFGTGALKVTPAHDFNDYDLGQKHQLPSVSVMGKDGKITAAGGPYAGLSFPDARNQVIQDLKDQGLLVKTEDHVHKVGLCQRCETPAEPMISKQWFVKIEPLAKPAIEAVEKGKITFTPKSWEKTYFEWMYNIRDWCISRQLWWGHQIPAWYCGGCSEVTVSVDTPKQCGHCKSKELKQDEDVLDTWFSSGLWPFATLGWPEKTKALKTFYPNSVLETGFDIIFFWVARMIMMGIHFMKEVPFSKVYLHPMVRDEKGEKMSKSKGNVIDPLGIINEQGADPLRFTFAIMASQGRDIKLAPQRVEGYRAFCNKLWNAVKFLHFQLENGSVAAPKAGISKWLLTHRAELRIENRWILSKLQTLIEQVEKGFNEFELNVSSQALYDFIWGELCDWFIELSKLPLRLTQDREATLYTLHEVLEKTLGLLHPICPFLTEKLWQSLPWKQKALALMETEFPSVVTKMRDHQAEVAMEHLKVWVDAIRNFRGENSLSPKAELIVRYHATSPSAQKLIEQFEDQVLVLCKLKGLEADSKSRPTDSLIPLSALGLELRIDLKGLVDTAAESLRLKKEIERVKDDLAHIGKKLTNAAFVDKAPAELVEKEKKRVSDLQLKLEELNRTLIRLEGLK